MRALRFLIGAAALAAAFSTSAAEVKPIESGIPLCDGSGTLVLTADGEQVAREVRGLVEAATAENFAGERVVKLLNTNICAQNGPHQGAWILSGTQSAMQVGVIPYGSGSGLLIASPRYTVITLLDAHVEKNRQ